MDVPETDTTSSEALALSSSEVGDYPATWARYLDVLRAEHAQSARELQITKERSAKAEYRAEGGDHSDIEQALDAVERATRLRNIAWTMFVQARALLSFGLESS